MCSFLRFTVFLLKIAEVNCYVVRSHFYVARRTKGPNVLPIKRRLKNTTAARRRVISSPSAHATWEEWISTEPAQKSLLGSHRSWISIHDRYGLWDIYD